MRTREFLRLNSSWSLAYDDNQWIVRQLTHRQDETYWNPLCYVGSRKSVLLSYLREKGIRISSEAQAYLDGMPATFLEWRDLKIR